MFYLSIVKLLRKNFNRIGIRNSSSKFEETKLSFKDKEERIQKRLLNKRVVGINTIMNELNNITLTVLSNGFAGTPKSFALGVPSHNYLFNIGEGIHRLALESKWKFPNTKSVFITCKSWDCFGGFVSTILNLQDNKKALKFHGPFDIVNIINNETFPFGYFAKMNLTQHDYDKDNDYKDELSTVKAIEMLENINEEVSARKRCKLEKADKVYSYKISLNNPQPNLIEKKIVEFKVPYGPLCAALKRGESVVLEDGSTVHPKDVCDYSNIKDLKILVLDCRNESYFDFIENNDEINDKTISSIVHLSNSKILSNRRYQEWMKSKEGVKQIVLDETRENIKSTKQICHQKTLNLLDDKIHPLFPKFKELNENTSSLDENIYYGLSNMRMHFRPNIHIVATDCFKETSIEEIKEGLVLEADHDVEERIKEVKIQVEELRGKQESERIYPIVNFLGTGSSVSAIYRNASGILFEINKNKSILLDCGEGTLEQMMCLYGESEYKKKLLKLNAIFVSHFHADHSQGLFSIIAERKRVFDELNIKYENLFLCVPHNVIDYLRMCFKHFDKNILNYTEIIINFNLYREEERLNSKKNIDDDEQRRISCLIESLNLKTFHTVPVIHVKHASGLVLETRENEAENESSFKLVFSGDCRPSDILIKAGMDCDLLIHEATFEPKMLNDAILKKHSTSSEAIKVGKQMNAKSTILWHFSQRYQKISIMNEVINYNNVSTSFDNMIVRRNDLELLPLFNETIMSLFKKEHDIIEKRNNSI